MLELTRVYHFSAGHRLADPALTDEANEALYGACARPHGHNYYLEVTVAGRSDPVTGMSVDLSQIDGAVRERVRDHVDHRTLEEVPALASVVTTGEGLARAFWRLLAPAVPAGALRRVTVVETAKNRFQYEGEAA
jgi:6-pyruvoyltetrahydropterin/6-carboxytetrahydropterin synthase